MKLFKNLLKISVAVASCTIIAQSASAHDVTQAAIIESLFPTRAEQELLKNLDDAACEEASRITEESRPAAPSTAQASNTAHLKLRAELIRQEILTMHIMKAFAVTASIASIAAGSYIFLLLLNK